MNSLTSSSCAVLEQYKTSFTIDLFWASEEVIFLRRSRLRLCSEQRVKYTLELNTSCHKLLNLQIKYFVTTCVYNMRQRSNINRY